MSSMQVITTVVTPATSYDLTILEYVLDDLGQDAASNAAMIGRWITQASKAAANYCNRVFVVETVKDEFWLSGRCSPLLQLSRYPVKAGTTPTVTEDGTTLTVTTDFRIDYDSGQLLRMDGGGLTTHWSACAIVVNYQSGFATIPEDLADAVLRMVRARWSARARDPNMRQESIPGLRDVTYWVPDQGDTGNMTPDVVDILDNYRRPMVF